MNLPAKFTRKGSNINRFDFTLKFISITVIGATLVMSTFLWCRNFHGVLEVNLC